MESNGATATNVQSAEEEIESLRKLLKESSTNAKKRDQQSFKLNCKLTQEKNQLVTKLATQNKVQEKLSDEIKILKEGLQFINGQFIKCMESLANFGVDDGDGDDGGGIEVKLNVSSDNLGAGGGDMYTNPKLYFENLFKNLSDIYTSKLTSLREETVEVEKRAKVWEGKFFKLVLQIKEGTLAKKRKRDADTSCQGQEDMNLATERKAAVIKKDVPPVAQGIKLNFSAAARLAIENSLKVTKDSDQGDHSEGPFEETGSENTYNLDDYEEFPTLENAIISQASLLALEDDGRCLDFPCSSSSNVEIEEDKEKTVRESPRRRKQSDGVAGEYGCPLCQDKFYSTFGLTAHLAEKHKNTVGLGGKDSSPPKKKARRMTITKKRNSF